MTYLLSQLWLCLLLATLLGGLIGWFFRGGCSKKLSLNEDKWETRFAKLTSERNALRMGVRKGDQYKLERNQLLSRLSAMERAAEISVASLKSNKNIISELKLKSSASKHDLTLEKNKVDTLTEQLSHAQKNLNKVDKQKQRLLSELEQTSTKLTTASNDVISLTSKHSDTEISYEETKQQNEQLLSELKTLKNEQVNTLQLKTELSAAQAKTESFLSRTSKAEEESKSIQAKYSAVKENLNQSIKQLSDAEVKIATLANENTELPELKEQLASNTSIIKHANKLTSQVDTYKAEADGYRAKLIDAESKLEVVTEMLSSEKSVMKNINSSADSTISKLEEELKKSREKLDSKAAKLSDIESDMNKLKSDYNQNTTHADNITKELSSTQNKLVDCEKQLKSSNEKIDKNSQLISEFEIEKEQISTSLKSSQLKHNEVKKELKGMLSNFDGQSVSLTDAKIRISKLKEEVSSLKTDIQPVLAISPQKVETNNADLQNNTKELNETRTAIKKFKELNSEKEKKIQILAEQLSTAKQQTHRADSELLTLQSQLKEKNSDSFNKSPKEYQVGQEKLKQELGEAQAELKKVKDQLLGAEACIKNYNIGNTHKNTKKLTEPAPAAKKLKPSKHTKMAAVNAHTNKNMPAKKAKKQTPQHIPSNIEKTKRQDRKDTTQPVAEVITNNPATASSLVNNKLRNINNLDEKNYKVLQKEGISTIENLLEKHPTLRSIRQTSEKTGIKSPLLESWCNRADLLRIKGVTSDYAELLYASGIRSVQHLALFNVKNLTKKLSKINDIDNIVMSSPHKPTVADWVTQAKRLEATIDY